MTAAMATVGRPLTAIGKDCDDAVAQSHSNRVGKRKHCRRLYVILASWHGDKTTGPSSLRKREISLDRRICNANNEFRGKSALLAIRLDLDHRSV